MHIFLRTSAFISSIFYSANVLFCLHVISQFWSPLSFFYHYPTLFFLFLFLLSYQSGSYTHFVLPHWLQKLFISQMHAAHTHKRKNTHTRTLSNTTLSTWRKTHTAQRQANTEQRKWLTMSKNACAYMHMHTLIYLLNTLHWYPFSSEMYCMPVYISVNVCVGMVTPEKRHCVSTEG